MLFAPKTQRYENILVYKDNPSKEGFFIIYYIKEVNLMYIKSPCNGKCYINDKSCVGCGRTLDEISNWSVMTDEVKNNILIRLNERK